MLINLFFKLKSVFDTFKQVPQWVTFSFFFIEVKDNLTLIRDFLGERSLYEGLPDAKKRSIRRMAEAYFMRSRFGICMNMLEK